MKKEMILYGQGETLRSQLSDAIDRSEFLRVQRFQNDTLHVVSKRDFGSLNLIEKQHFSIRAQLASSEDRTSILYEIRGNATFRVLSVVVPLLMLPMVLIGRGADSSSFLMGLIVYLALVGFATFILLREDYRLRKEGERAFEEVLKQLDTRILKRK